MPQRVFNSDEVAKYLHLSRSDIEALVKRNEIPFRMQAARSVFLRGEIDAWASQRILGMGPRPLADYHRAAAGKGPRLARDRALITELMTAERIDPEFAPRTKASAIRGMVKLAEQTALVCDAADLLASIEAREHLCSTAIEGGIALLHPRHHEPYMFVDSFIVLGRAVRPLHAGSIDGSPTDLFFLVCCQDDAIHLHALTRLCTLCQRTHMLADMRAAGNATGILDAIVGAEADLLRKM